MKIAEYEALIKKKAEVEAEKDKAVAVIMAQKKLKKDKALIAAERELEVSKLMVKSAERKRRAHMLEGQGLAERKRLIYKADGALHEKLDAYVDVMTVLAKELGRQRWVPI